MVPLNIEVLRLSPGDDLRRSLEQAMGRFVAGQPVTAACVLSVVGSLSQAVLRFAQREEGSCIDGPLELLTLSGTLSPDGAHLHASVADASGHVLGGHVMAGCRVRTTAEIVLGLLPQWHFSRQTDPRTGYLELVARHANR